MFEKLATVGKSVAETIKTMDIGTVGKFVSGGALLLGSAILIVVANSGSKDIDQEYYKVSESDDIDPSDSNDVDEETSEPNENSEK